MANTTTRDYRYVAGNRVFVGVTVDITSLENAGNEPWDPTTETEIDVYDHLTIGGIENADSYVITWDHLNEQIHVSDFTGSNVTSTTDVGEVEILVQGRR